MKLSLVLSTLLILFAGGVWAENVTCTVKGAFTVNENGELQEGGYFPVKNLTFKVDTSSGNITGLGLDNMKSPLCRHQVLSEGTSDTSFKVFTNCGFGSQVEYLTIKTFSNNEFLAIATSNAVLTGSCK